jgi:recombination protein RecT
MAKKPALEVCTKESIYMALLDMTIQGLSAAKKQGYFIVYGKKLQFSRSYFGTMAVTKRLDGVVDVVAQVVYAGDEFEYVVDLGVKKITKHVQKYENIDPEKIVAAYAIVIKEDGNHYTDIMNIASIKKSWSKSKTGGATHKDFAEEMAKKTVITRACKHFVNTSDDSDLIIDAFARTDEKSVDEIVGNEITENANSEALDVSFTVEDEPFVELTGKFVETVQEATERKPGF